MLLFPDFARLLADEMASVPAASGSMPLAPSTRLLEDLEIDSMGYLLVLLFVEDLAEVADPPDLTDFPLTVQELYDYYCDCSSLLPDGDRFTG